ncbi:ABC transporter permease [Coxiella endosymbiont of Amblyomma nuttalli]|uniref:ABC transporter permease n=1 Tax=Coxiella endosymbiont of Amblyomma nuttalli TaxID=2749996 RepID=UPI001BA61872|nr:ABC transporter permease [Coxiella endosymbiont of Amblyomma nuttalli]QTS84144.1 ABC-2 type transporter [Coxiella endosymbiont of Amblyomma nuttalli]
MFKAYLQQEQLQLARKDFIEVFYMARFWIYLGWAEIRWRYKRSVLGPWWITISMSVFIGAIGIVYSKLFQQHTRSYLPFLVSGMLTWTFISSLIIESTNLFQEAKTYITQMKIPYLLQAFKLVFRHLIIFAHNFVVYPLVMLIFHKNPFWQFLVFIPGIFLVTLNMLWISVFVGMVGTRYQDFAQIVGSLITVAFFVSPITWQPEQLHQHLAVFLCNPFYYFLDLVRSPLIGVLPQNSSWVFGIAFLFIGSAITFLFFTKFRRKIAFWIN